MDFAPYLAAEIAKWLVGTNMPSAPANIYVGLWDGHPEDGGAEATATIRVAGRVSLTKSRTDNVVTSTADADFGEAAGGADVTHVVLHDAASTGNPLLVKELDSPVTVTTGQNVKVSSGDLSVTVQQSTS